MMNIDKKDLNILNVAGYGWSGSGAIVDLLKEIKNTEVFPGEFRMIKDPNGIIDLENQLKNNWQILNSNYAIYKFEKELRKYYNKNYSFCRTDFYNFKNKIGKIFDTICEEYISELTVTEWKGDSFIYRFDENKVFILIKRIIGKLFGFKIENKRLRFSDPFLDFRLVTRVFFDKLFKSYINCETQNLILDQSLPVCNGGSFLDYFNNAKLFVVTRDPRDVYYHALSQSWMPSDVNVFVLWYKAQMDFSFATSMDEDKTKVYRTSFEKLVVEYEEECNYIYDFLKIHSGDHIFPKRYFVPEKSYKNIGIYKKLNKNKDIAIIEKVLSPFCYELIY